MTTNPNTHDDIIMFYWPKDPNPYQTLLYRNLSLELRARGIGFAIINQLKGKRQVIFHLHWLYRIFNRRGLIWALVAAPVFLLSLAAFQLLGGKVFWTIHNLYEHDNSNRGLEKLFRKTLAQRFCDHIFLHSRKAIDMCESAYGIALSCASVTPHGSYLSLRDEQNILPREPETFKPEGITRFLHLGRIRHYKNLDKVALAVIKAGLEGAPVNLKILGVGRGSELFYLEQLARDYPRFLTVDCRFVPDGEIEHEMRFADWIVLNQTDVLTSGTAFLSMSFGVPLLAKHSDLLEVLVNPDGGTSLFEENCLSSKVAECASIDRETLAHLSSLQLAWSRTLNWQLASDQIARAAKPFTA